MHMLPCSLLLYLGANATWKARAINEYKASVENHTGTLFSTEPLYKRLGAVPLSAWKNELPGFDLIIHKNLRMTRPVLSSSQN